MKGKKILIGVTGSIAAYKVASLIRLLVQAGNEVKVIMTPLAKAFITPLTLATLSKNPILVDFYNPENGDWNSHVSLGLWADIFVIAPATANTIAKMNHGIGDNLLLTTYLSSRCPVFIAPAMDLDMYKHMATQKNILDLKNKGCIFFDPTEGELASGLSGKGRMQEPQEIFDLLSLYFKSKGILKGKKILVTAGPTIEKIDPVRYISNFSTGKMGYAIANQLANLEAEVILVSGPTTLKVENQKIRLIKVCSALEMYERSKEHFDQCDGAVLVAAVADYRPETMADNKVKRTEDKLTLKLTANPDIAKTLGGLKRKGQIIVGFALETDKEIENAIAKLESKNLDFIVLNSLNDADSGFSVDTNTITIIEAKTNNVTRYPNQDKNLVAQIIVDKIVTLLP